jgi:hypothetical protein
MNRGQLSGLYYTYALSQIKSSFESAKQATTMKHQEMNRCSKEIKDLELAIAPIQAGVTVQLYNIFFEFGNKGSLKDKQSEITPIVDTKPLT